jgi:hypothetical protein
MVKIGLYDYPNSCMDTNMIDKSLRDEISEMCKKKNLNKGKLIEEFYKTVLIRLKDGSINATNGYVTMNIFREPIQKKIR